jgi:hypothetical protein
VGSLSWEHGRRGAGLVHPSDGLRPFDRVA